jgi:HEPN domain-containing protein
MELDKVWDVVSEWINWAETDIWNAETLLNTACNPRHRRNESVAWHSQQAAEKILKAYLIWKGDYEVRRFSHNLLAIRTECADTHDTAFNDPEFIKQCAHLNAFSNAKYPDFNQDVTAEESKYALDNAKKIFDFIHKKFGNKA